MAREQAVITLLCEDDVGIVETISNLISQHNGNWLESRMAKLSGKFAGILNISIDSSQMASLASALTQLKARGIQVQIERENKYKAQKGPTKQINFEFTGADRQGIVHEVSQCLAAKGISISEIATECTSMAWSGEPLFSAKGKLAAPASLDTNEIIEELDRVADHLGIDISLSAKL